MAELNSSQLIRNARELCEESEDLCARSRRAIEKSKRLEEIFTASHPASVHARRKQKDTRAMRRSVGA